MRYTLNILILFILLGTSSYAYSALDPKQEIDSLENRLKSAKGNDAISIINQLSDKYRIFNVDKSIELSNEALEKAKKSGNEKEQADALNNLGKSAVAKEKLNEAINYFQWSFDLSNKSKYVEGISKSLNNICFVYGRLKDFAKVEEYHKKAIKILSDLDSKEELGNIYLSFGDAYKRNSQTDKAKECFESALENFTQVNNKEKIAQTNDNLGGIYIEWSDYAKAIKYLNTSLELRKTIGDKKKIISTQSIIGYAYSLKGDFEKAISFYQENLKLSHEINFGAGIANSLNSIAPLYIKMNQYEKAIEYFEEALGIYEQMGASGKEIAGCLNNLGNAYKELNDRKKAIEYYEKALAILEETGANNSELATLLVNIGDEYEKSENNNKALEFYQKAFRLHDDVGNKEGMANSLFHIGSINIRIKNYNSALEQFNKSLAISQEINSQSLILSNLQRISDTYKAMGNYDKALEFKDQYIMVKEIMVNKELNGQLAEMQTKFDMGKKQHQIELMQKESEVQATRQKFIVIASIIGLLTLIVTVFFMYNRYRMKKKSHAALEVRNQQIMQQKEEIEAQRDEIEHQKEIIEEANREVMDSIRYAKRIQSAVLPSKDFLDNLSHEHFIVFKPKDIVSGDFYWMTKRNEWTIIVAADCTGHGVPGAFMSMLGISFLNEIIAKPQVQHAGQALDELRALIIKSLQQKGVPGEQKDGMDLVLVAINEKTMTLEFAGANNSMFHIRNGELTEYKADKQPIAIYIDMIPFTNHVVELQKGDVIYMASDGYQDQFGGPKGKKFMIKQMKNMFVEHYSKSMEEQGILYNKAFNDWIAYIDPVTNQPYAQTDDVLLVGVRI